MSSIEPTEVETARPVGGRQPLTSGASQASGDLPRARGPRSALARASAPTTPPDELRGLLASRRRAVWRALAVNPSTPADVLDALSRLPDEVPPWSAAPNVTNIGRHYWRMGNTFSYAAAVAAHPSVPAATLDRLAATGNTWSAMPSPHGADALW